MSETTIFDRIISGEMDADVLYEDNDVMAFRDINPQAPTHVLVIPKQRIATTNHLSSEDDALIGKLMRVARDVAKQEEIAESGYRVVVNCGDHGGQEVQHLHLHLLGGRSMRWPPG